MMLHIKYQSFGLVVSDKKFSFFSYFPYTSLCKKVTAGQAHFWPKGHNLNTFGRGPLDDATYQISRLLPLLFLARIFLKLSFRKSIFSLCNQDMQRTRII